MPTPAAPRAAAALGLLALLLGPLGLAVTPAAAAGRRTLVPVGSGYRPETLRRFAQAAVEHDSDGTVAVVVLPITFAADAAAISPGERQQNLALAETRRAEVEAACRAVLRPGQTCQARLAPVLVRADAFLQSNLDLVPPDVDGLYLLGGDQTIAMQVVANTPLEARLAAAYAAGAVVGGNSAGAAVESLTMLGGYTGNNGPAHSLRQGAVDLWQPGGPDPNRRGLSFGLPNVVLDQHVFERGRLGRLLNASFTTGLLGLGVDADTAASLEAEARLTDVAGASAAMVVDLLTYSARGRFAGPAHSLSLRGAATHIIPPGGYGYDLLQRRPLVAGRPEPAPAAAGRTFAALRLPAGCGPLWLAGGLAGDPAGAVTQRFAALSGGPAARLVVLALGYAQTAEAQADAQAFAAALHSQAAAVAWFVLEAKLDQAALQGALGPATGVLITAPDQSRVLDALAGAPAVVSALRARWQQGLALLADNAAAAALGEAVSLNAPSTAASLEADAVRSFRADGVPIRPGLAFVPGVAVEPRLLPDRHWGQLYNHVHRRPARLAVGVDVNTALELSASGATVVGESAVVTLDGRCAGFSLGSNGALGARWVLLDTFAAGEPVHP